jgi:catechol-2,3-dioxygenase
MIAVRRLNHAVLWVRELDRSVDFYTKAFGFEVIASNSFAAFLRAADSGNHHDLGLFSLGSEAPGPEKGRVGLYHLAWEVESIHDLAVARDVLRELRALVGASDHGATKSLYGKDPDGNEFEIMWMVPREHWGEYESDAPVLPLDLEHELERHGHGRSAAR